MRDSHRRYLLVTAVCIAAAAIQASPAMAGSIVFTRANEVVHAINDTGGNDRALFGGQTIGAHEVTNPWVDPDGTTILFGGNTGSGSDPCGNPCTGVYLFDGSLTRLSSPTSPSNIASIYQDDAEFDAAGTVMFQGTAYTFNPYSSSGYIGRIGAGAFGARCTDSELTFSAHPTQAGKAAIAGCFLSGSGYPIDISGANRQNEVTIGFDDARVRDLAFRPDGGALADVEGGNLPGIWHMVLGNPVTFQRVVSADAGETLSNPHYIGTGSIVFEYEGNIYRVPTTCNPCTVAQATQLTTDGVNHNPSWTSATDFPTLGSGSGSSGGGGGGGAGGVVVPGPPSNVFTVGGVVSSGNGLATLTVNVPGPGTVTVKDAKASASAARKKKRKKVPALFKPATVAAAKAGPVKITLKPTSAGRKLLAKKKAFSTPAKITFLPTGGTASSQTKIVRFVSAPKRRSRKK